MNNPVSVLVIDGQGGKVGKALVETIKKSCPQAVITAVGTNAMATSTMLKAGADYAATGENSVVVASRTADIIVGPVGMVIADAMIGEITPKMALAIAQSRAKIILIPFSRCDHIVVGTSGLSLSDLIDEAAREIALLAENC